MHNIIINMNTLKVVNYDIKCKPFEFIVEIENIENIKKTIKEKVKNHKTLFGERLYIVEHNGNKIQIVESQLKNRICEPVFEYINTDKNVSLVDFPTKFTLKDIIDAKEEELKNNYYSFCKLFEIDLYKLVNKEYENHKADIGYKIIKIHKNGEVNLNPIILDKMVSNIYIPIDLNKIQVKYRVNESKEFVNLNNNNLLLENTISSIELILINQSNDIYELNNFYILGK